MAFQIREDLGQVDMVNKFDKQEYLDYCNALKGLWIDERHNKRVEMLMSKKTIYSRTVIGCQVIPLIGIISEHFRRMSQQWCNDTGFKSLVGTDIFGAGVSYMLDQLLESLLDKLTSGQYAELGLLSAIGGTEPLFHSAVVKSDFNKSGQYLSILIKPTGMIELGMLNLTKDSMYSIEFDFKDKLKAITFASYISPPPTFDGKRISNARYREKIKGSGLQDILNAFGPLLIKQDIYAKSPGLRKEVCDSNSKNSIGWYLKQLHNENHICLLDGSSGWVRTIESDNQHLEYSDEVITVINKMVKRDRLLCTNEKDETLTIHKDNLHCPIDLMLRNVVGSFKHIGKTYNVILHMKLHSRLPNFLDYFKKIKETEDIKVITYNPVNTGGVHIYDITLEEVENV